MKKTHCKFKYFDSFQGFTLVELIVTIAILAILATIWFVSYSSYIINSRDSARVSELTRISDALIAFSVVDLLPLPENSLNIIHTGNTISIQWHLWNNVFEAIRYNEIALDPKDNTPFVYSVNAARDGFQILSYMERSWNFSSSIWNINRFPRAFGSRLGILLDFESLRPIQEVVNSSFELTSPERQVVIFLRADEFITNNSSALLALPYVTRDKWRWWTIENNNFVCLDLDIPDRCLNIWF